ncbi:Glu-tRNA(Gln) amidotransferase subunit GatD [Methanobrevibacter curvatus]|uniref:Glutamyl-tRNA(Gln) amidotransferase subunit D n=1 Tax=Methanobrevibacter curvatus TaxID=49547 RepID=A0A162FE76_9EURY|nr:Glu-tRNA(Gln) amidotransferase subunit GatD [Methanobrevibacter curvatus]KZX11725.1 L-asparaginase 1 [Methanobrevibacter curvatus]
MGYKGSSENFLNKSDVSIGDTVLIEKNDVSYEGILLDRSEDADDGCIVLKLDSGYNIGVNINNATIGLIEKGDKPKISYKPVNIEYDDKKLDISIISTGGTVSSIIDYKTGAVHPVFTAEDLLRSNPELLDLANIDVKALYNILSENMKPEYWVNSAKSIADEVTSGADGVVVAHGTDTMHFTSAALSFMIKSPVPIVVTGAQRSSDRPSSDAHLNLINSVGAAKSEIAEVTVCMHSTLNDDYCDLHRGTKVRKMHTSRRDTFRSIDFEPLANVKEGKVSYLLNDFKKRNQEDLVLNNKIEEKVAIVKTYPGISSEIINYHIDKGYKGLLIEGTGLGHLPENLLDSIKRANQEEIAIVMTSQCIYGRVNMNVYSTGRKLLNAGIISGKDMIPEVAFVKLAWALGQSSNIEEVKNIIQTNLAGELNEKSSTKYFLN